MNTVAYNEALPDDEKLKLLKDAKAGTWYDGWRPYCTQSVSFCTSRLTRMQQMKYGFLCTHCGNMIGWNLQRLDESPLNNIANQNSESEKLVT